MKMPMRLRASAVAALTMMGLSACASIPHSGPVEDGVAVVAPPAGVLPFATGPGADDEPKEVVSGFIAASGLGVLQGYEVAREYLTVEASRAWDPSAGVIVYGSGDIPQIWDEETGTYELSVPVVARIDDSGRMTETEDGTRQSLTFIVNKGELDRWRIADLEQGVLISEAEFDALFRQVSLVFASVDRTYGVPEVRWVPKRNEATFVTRELIEGPSPWLADAVVSGIQPGTTLVSGTVPVAAGTATISLSAGAAEAAADRQLAEQQLRHTLGPLPDVAGIAIEVGGIPLDSDAERDLVISPSTSQAAIVVVGHRLGKWTGNELLVTVASAGRVPAGSAAPALSPDGSVAAIVVDGTKLYVTDAFAGGQTSPAFVPYSADDAAVENPMVLRLVAQGSNLTDPSVDRHGWVWTYDSGRSQDLLVVSADGTSGLVSAPWLAGRAVQNFVVSRDGARVAVLSRVGSTVTLDVAGIVRDENGVPTQLTQPKVVGANIASGVDVTWLDDVSLAVLGSAEDDTEPALYLITVGGRTEHITGVKGAVDIAASNGERTLTLRLGTGEVYVRSGTGWTKIAEGVDGIEYSG